MSESESEKGFNPEEKDEVVEKTPKTKEKSAKSKTKQKDDSMEFAKTKNKEKSEEVVQPRDNLENDERPPVPETEVFSFHNWVANPVVFLEKHRPTVADSHSAAATAISHTRRFASR